tara:strand:- start:174 stop:395 length:222 start_codon:yes stop_codon:yes gene_type:complete
VCRLGKETENEPMISNQEKYINLSTRKRDGVFRIDLIDGVELVERLKDLRLGVEVETVENVVVDPSWFTSRFS